jgi:hypothetical protein
MTAALTPALTPALALDYLRELSADLKAGLVLDAAGERLAGPPALLAPARALLASAPGAAAITARAPNGIAFAARDARHALVVATGPLALEGLVHHDLRAVLAVLAEPDVPGERAVAAALGQPDVPGERAVAAALGQPDVPGEHAEPTAPGDGPPSSAPASGGPELAEDLLTAVDSLS